MLLQLHTTPRADQVVLPGKNSGKYIFFPLLLLHYPIQTGFQVAITAPSFWENLGIMQGLQACPAQDQHLEQRASVQFSSVARSCPTLWNPMNRSTPGLPVHHQLPEFTQTHVLRVGDAIQTSHPLSSPSPPASNPSQHQSLFQ